jgi:hypothetical protein
MIVKKTNQLGNFKRGINLYVPRRRSSGAPSGIVAATAGNLVITFADTINKSYTKYGVVPNAAWIYGEGDYAWALEWNLDGDNKWRLRNDYYEADPVVRAKSPAATSAIIPTDGWVYTEGSGPTVTITAA